MSILIKGMEMPTDCHNCPLGFGGGCYCGTSADEYMCPDHGRAEWCPLVPVPPHGRLIDADAFIKRISELVHKAKTDGFDLGAAWYTAFIRHIELAPIIIPAEEDE